MSDDTNKIAEEKLSYGSRKEHEPKGQDAQPNRAVVNGVPDVNTICFSQVEQEKKPASISCSPFNSAVLLRLPFLRLDELAGCVMPISKHALQLSPDQSFTKPPPEETER